MKYQVLRKLRWRGQDYQRGDTLLPKTQDEEYRCGLLAETGVLASLFGDELLRNLQSAGVQLNPRVKPVSVASNNVKQSKGEKNNG